MPILNSTKAASPATGFSACAACAVVLIDV